MILAAIFFIALILIAVATIDGCFLGYLSMLSVLTESSYCEGAKALPYNMPSMFIEVFGLGGLISLIGHHLRNRIDRAKPKTSVAEDAVELFDHTMQQTRTLLLTKDASTKANAAKEVKQIYNSKLPELEKLCNHILSRDDEVSSFGNFKKALEKIIQHLPKKSPRSLQWAQNLRSDQPDDKIFERGLGLLDEFVSSVGVRIDRKLLKSASELDELLVNELEKLESTSRHASTRSGFGRIFAKLKPSHQH